MHNTWLASYVATLIIANMAIIKHITLLYCTNRLYYFCRNTLETFEYYIFLDIVFNLTL